MHTTVLLDFSNIAYSTIFACEFNPHLRGFEEKLAYWKYLMLNSIRKQKVTHRPDELIICCDSPSWRKKYFQYYKAKREDNRKNSDFDWSRFYEGMDSLLDDVRTTFRHFKVLKTKHCEADDIIAILALELSPKRKKVVICSRDKDFLQLIKGNIYFWELQKDRFISTPDPKAFLIKHILKGDGSDGVPNVRSDDDTFIVDGKRQKPCGDKQIEKILTEGLQSYIKREGLLKNWKRNKRLIQLSKVTIPGSVWDAVMSEYDAIEPLPGNYVNILQYFRKYKFRDLANKIDQFI